MAASTPAERFQAALDLHETGVDLMRQNLRRRHPGESAEDIQARLLAWLGDRPPDTPGRLRPPPA